MAKNPIQEAIKAGKVGQAMKLESKRQLQAMGRTGGAPNITSLMSVFAKARNNAADKKDNPDPTPDPNPTPDPARYSGSGDWSDIVKFHFQPKMKGGGLVRGCGVAKRGVKKARNV